MQIKRPPISVIVPIALVVLAAIYYGYRVLSNEKNSALQASGSIEAVDVSVSPEISGKVVEVFVDEGQAVKSGDPLLRLDDSLLKAQRAVAAAGLESARAGEQTARDAMDTAKDQYQITLETALAQDKQARLQDWFSKDQNQFDQPNWYFTRTEQIQAVQTQVDEAREALEKAEAKLNDFTQSLEKADFLAAEQRLMDARQAYMIAQEVNNRAQNSTTDKSPVGLYNLTHCGTNQGYRLANGHLTNLVYSCTGDENLSETSQTLYDRAQDELESAQQSYKGLLNSKAADDVLQARAEVSVMQEGYYAALDRLRVLQTGDQSPAVTAAQGAVDQAQAVYDQSQKAVEEAKANLTLVETQIEKLTVHAPMDGVIMTRNVEPGEFVQPGATAMTMANLNEITITVYVPEDRYGEISLGQQAVVSVDSFPGQTFTAIVVHIADQAEFTPRNVQTVEGRSSTVYAVKLKVTDPGGKLKIGMPADVTFNK
jgi:multidrug resistance efflux pump